MISQTKPTDEELQRARVKNAIESGDMEPGRELREQEKDETDIQIDLRDEETTKRYINTLSKLWTHKGPDWHAELWSDPQEVFNSPLYKMENRQVNEGPVSKEEISEFPASGSIENFGEVIPDNIVIEAVQEKPRFEFSLEADFGKKMAEQENVKSYEEDNKVSDMSEYPVKVDFKLLFSWLGKVIGSGLFKAAKLGGEAAVSATKQVTKEMSTKVPTKEEQEKANKKKEEDARKKANMQSFFNNLMNFAKGFNFGADKALDAKRAYVNKKVGLSEDFRGTFEANGQMRTDIEILLEKKESEESQKQEKMVKQAESQSIQGPQINIDAAVEGGTGKGGVANISSQAAG